MQQDYDDVFNNTHSLFGGDVNTNFKKHILMNM